MFIVLKELVRDGEQQEIARADTREQAMALAETESLSQTDCRVVVEIRDGAVSQLVAVFDPAAAAP